MMGDVGGAECDLGGVVDGGRSAVIVGSGDRPERGVASDESIFEGVNPSSRLGDSDGGDSCAES